MSAGGYDAFVARFDAAGDVSWGHSYGSEQRESALGVAFAPGAVYVSGLFRGSVDFGGGTLAPTSEAAHGDGYILRLSAEGELEWQIQLGGHDELLPFGLASDASGSLVLGGSFAGSLDCGGGPLVAGEGRSVFLAKYDASGDPVWSKRFSAFWTDGFGWDVACDSEGRILFGGSFFGYPLPRGGPDFGQGPVAGIGYYDGFIAEFQP